MMLEKTHTGFSAYAKEYPIFTTATSIPELMANAYEAVDLYFEDQETPVLHEEIRFEIDFVQFFQYYRVLNSKFLAHRIGMNPTLLSQYIQGHKTPSETQKEKIIAGIHRIGRELSEIRLIRK